jgi:hypothetical protein
VIIHLYSFCIAESFEITHSPQLKNFVIHPHVLIFSTRNYYDEINNLRFTKFSTLATAYCEVTINYMSKGKGTPNRPKDPEGVEV